MDATTIEKKEITWKTYDGLGRIVLQRWLLVKVARHGVGMPGDLDWVSYMVHEPASTASGEDDTPTLAQPPALPDGRDPRSYGWLDLERGTVWVRTQEEEEPKE